MSLPVTDSVPTHSENSIANMTPFKERSSNDKIIVESSQPRVMTLKSFRFKTSTFLNHFCREHSRLYRRSTRKKGTEKVEPEKLSSRRLSMTQSHSSYNWNFNFRELNFLEDARAKKITMWPEFLASNLLRRNETRPSDGCRGFREFRVFQEVEWNLVQKIMLRDVFGKFRISQPFPRNANRARNTPALDGRDSSRSTFSVVYRDNETIRNINNDQTCTMH